MVAAAGRKQIFVELPSGSCLDGFVPDLGFGPVADRLNRAM